MKYKHEVESRTIEIYTFSFLYGRLWVQICKDITYCRVSTYLPSDGQVQTVWKSVLE